MRFVVLPIIVASLLGDVKTVNIYHLKLNSEDSPSAYDLESAQDDDPKVGQDATVEAADGSAKSVDSGDQVKGKI